VVEAVGRDIYCFHMSIEIILTYLKGKRKRIAVNFSFHQTLSELTECP
jgi:hypothetical protein